MCVQYYRFIALVNFFYFLFFATGSKLMNKRLSNTGQRL